MKLIKQILIFFITIFFKIFFLVFGEPKISSRLKSAVNLYKGNSFSSLFKIIRVWDAPFEEIEKAVPDNGKIVDLGCGDGILGNYLALSSKKRNVVGIEFNKKRINEANKGLANTKFVYGDILKSNFTKADAILLIHVLHHLESYKDQEKLLTKCKERLNRGGKIIIAEIIERPLHKFLFTALTDFLIVPILFEGRLINTMVHFRTLDKWKKLFKKMGFKYKYSLNHQDMPFSHAIFTLE